MPISQEKFGITDDGEEVIRYTLTNGNNFEVRIINYGGIITNIFAPDKNGTRADIVLGFNSFDGYKVKHPYFGALIGRYGNR
ncbi:GALM-like protein [Mya arenaria]|uniref:Galactose mutarotase n=1 Tax=Mya arenaria TaxID=6604 RepID=A0ABY7F7N9_MYAAR|nr:GALM-like protein [Mya arenaria]